MMRSRQQKTLSIVIPCYRSELTIREVVEEILSVTGHLTVMEIILVDDGSPDHVWDVIEELVGKYEIVKGIQFARNFGQHSALMAGYRMARGDYIVSMDDDGQSDPVGIELMLERLEEGYDVVYAKYPVFNKSRFRIFASYINRRMSEIMIDKPKTIQVNSFNIMRKFVKEEIVRYAYSFPYVGGLVFRATQNISEVEVNQRSRANGQSSYTLLKLFSLWMNGLTVFSAKPLRLSSILGVICAFLGFLFGFYTIVRKLIYPDILVGYSSLIATILFIGGVIMMLLGMMGEYIGRIYVSINCAPQYVIRKVSQNAEEQVSADEQ